MAQERYWARRPFVYTEDLSLAQGEVFELRGLRNDEKLVRLGYCELVEKGERTFEHGPTGKRFISERHRDIFARQYRKGARDHMEMTQQGHALIDTTGDAEMNRIEQEAPLYMDKTTASRK